MTVIRPDNKSDARQLLTPEEERRVIHRFRAARHRVLELGLDCDAARELVAFLHEDLQQGNLRPHQVAWTSESNMRRGQLLNDLQRLKQAIEARQDTLALERLAALNIRREWLYFLADKVEQHTGSEAAATVRRSVREARRILGSTSRRVLRGNLGLVFQHAHRQRGRGVDLDDLIQEGSSAVLIALDRFDPERGNRFITYASWWVRQAMTRAIENGAQLIRLPSHQHTRLRALLQAEYSLRAQLAREPTSEELEQHGGLTRTQIDQLRSAQGRRPVSLDQPLSEDSGSGTLEDVLPSDDSACPEQETLLAQRSRRLVDALATLPTRERYVVERRFGVNRRAPTTLAEIAVELGLSRERVRQIEQHALTTLRHRTHI